MPSPITGQATCTGASNAIALSTSPVACQQFTIYAPQGNSAAVYIGGSTVTSTTGFAIDPGGQVTYTRNIYQSDNRYELEPSDFYVAGTSNDKVTWLASP